MSPNPTMEEHAAASVVSELSGDRWKRTSEDEIERAAKKARVTPELGPSPELGSSIAPHLSPEKIQLVSPGSESGKRELVAAPFYYYRDFSREIDPDPLTPLTPPGRVPNFPAKMHAILSRADLADVVAWMPHGRSWRVLKPREFETRVIPTYFEHAKFSSFIRQANGWGFRRVTQGRDRNSYYHELFLRGLPHLCKEMKRPGVAEKGSADSEHEPDFHKISEIYTVPDKAEDESIMLQCIVSGGPKARMPIYSGGYLSADKIKAIQGENSAQSSFLAPSMLQMNTYQHVFDNQMMQPTPMQPPQQQMNPMMFFPQGFMKAPTQVTQSPPIQGVDAQMVVSNAADRMNFNNNGMAPLAPLPPSTAASQFAAGFAAATALNSNHMRNVMGNPFVSIESELQHS
jgi:hypothetical protein